MKKWTFLISMTIVSGCILMACGSSGTASQPEVTTEQTTSAAETTGANPESDETAAGLPEDAEGYKSACIAFDYKEYFRNDQKHIGEKIKIDVAVNQVMEGGFRGYDMFENEYYINDMRTGDDIFRIMEDDFVTVYGEYGGVNKITRAIGDYDSDIFTIDGKYIDLHEEGAVSGLTEPSALPVTEEGTVQAFAGNEDYIFPESNSRSLTEADVAGLSADTLRIAKNEIYARHGRIFTSADLQEYFGGKSWYQGSISADQFDEKVFNQFEKDNIQFLQKHIEGGADTDYGSRGLVVNDSMAIPQKPGIYNYYSNPADKNSLSMQLTIDEYIGVCFMEDGHQVQRTIDLSNMNDQEYVDETGTVGIIFDGYGKTATYTNSESSSFNGVYTYLP